MILYSEIYEALPYFKPNLCGHWLSMKSQFKILFIILGMIFVVGGVYAKINISSQEKKQTIDSTKVTSANIHVDDIVIKDLTNAQVHNSPISDDEHKRLVSKLSDDAEKEISSWMNRQVFFGITAIFLAVLGGIWAFFSTTIEKRIDNHIKSFDDKKEKAIEATAEVKYEIKLAQETLKELRKKEIEINKEIEDFQNEIETKEKELFKLDTKLNDNIESLSYDLSSQIKDETSRLEKKINVFEILIDKIDKIESIKNEIIDELLIDLESKNIEKRERAAELLTQFKIESNKITDNFVKILKAKPDIAFGSLLLNGLGELDGDKESLKNYLIELSNDLSNPNILAIIGALGSFNDSKGIESDVINRLISILQSDLDNQDFSSDITASKIKGAIALALSRYTDKSSNAVEDLVKLLKDEEYETRKNAAIALGDIGSKAKSAIPSLKRLEDDEYIEVKKAALEAIEKINHVLLSFQATY